MSVPCAFCGADVDPASTFCPSCHSYLKWDTPTPSPDSVASPHDMPPPPLPGGDAWKGDAARLVVPLVPHPSRPVLVPAPASAAAATLDTVRQESPDAAALTVVVRESSVRVDPGGQAETVGEVTNLGSRVDEVRLAVELTFQGQPVPSFAQPTPTTVNLYPQAHEDVRVQFTPPRDSRVPAGLYDWRLHATSSVRGDVTRVATGTVDVAPFSSVSAELTPELTTGRRRRFQHWVALRNNGNTPWQTVLRFSKCERLSFPVPPAPLVLAAGETRNLPLEGSVRRRWFGKADTLPFQAELDTPGSDTPPVRLIGTRIQRPLLPAWLLTALAAVLGLGIAAYAAFGHPDTKVEVPAVDGMPATEAQQILQDDGFTVTVTETPDQIPPGTVIRTSPDAGEGIDKGSPVTLYVSTGPATVEDQVTIPSVLGLTGTEAQTTLENLGLTVRTVEQTGDTPTGQALGTDPASSSIVATGTTVVVLISAGPPTTPTPTPGPTESTPPVAPSFALVPLTVPAVPGADALTVTKLRMGYHNEDGGFDRIVVHLSASANGYDVWYADTPFPGQGAAPTPVDVSGTTSLQVVIRGATLVYQETPTTPQAMELKNVQDVLAYNGDAGTVQIGIGLDHQADIRVFALAKTTSQDPVLVIDIRN